MKEEKNNIIYSNDVIRKYLDGELSASEMQALEKAALKDPFLADALEGFEISRNQSVTFESGLDELNKRLNHRIQEKDRKKGFILFFSGWRAVASLILLAGASLFVYMNIFTHSGLTSLASGTKKESPGEKELAPSVKSREEKMTDSSNTSSGEVVSTDKRKLPDTRPIEYPLLKNNKETAGIAGETKNLSKDTSSLHLSDNRIAREEKEIPAASTESIAPSSSRKIPEVTFDKASAEPLPIIKGVVTDPKGIPISGASVSLARSKIKTSTDQNGFFKISAWNRDSNMELLINTVGYQSVSIHLNADSSNMTQIQLQPASTALNEVVVTGYAKKEANKNVEPEGGWDSFYKYVNQHKKLKTADSLLTGQEIITFKINYRGETYSYKIEKSISPAHDKTAIQLIEEGPDWNILKGTEQNCRIIISYP